MDEEKNQVLFYFRKEEYGWLSNFERAEQVINGIKYPTNEHYYQSEKTNSKEIKDWILAAPSAWLAMKAGDSLRPKEKTENWELIKLSIMKKGLRTKFLQNPDLRKKLIETGNARIHEDSPTDKFWGVKGSDHLGKLLMEVRNELKIKQ